MQLRTYRPSDLDALFALDQQCFTTRFRFSRALLRRVVEGADTLVRVASRPTQDGCEEIVGFCAGKVETTSRGKVAYVNTLDVAPHHRQQGVGQALMCALERDAWATGALWMLLHVSVDNQAATGLYTRLEFLRGRLARHYYGRGFHAWEYKKALAPQAVSQSISAVG